MDLTALAHRLWQDFQGVVIKSDATCWNTYAWSLGLTRESSDYAEGAMLGVSGLGEPNHMEKLHVGALVDHPSL